MASPSLSDLVGFDQKVVVGVGDFAASNNASGTIATYSLGSCIGVTIYDPVARVGGLLHFMLPDSSINLAKARQQPAMFADTGIPTLFRAAYQMKAEKHRVLICLAGGAHMMDQAGVFNIGKRNRDAAIEIFNQHGLTVHSMQIGGLVSRTMTLAIATGEVRLKTSGLAEEQVLCKGT